MKRRTSQVKKPTLGTVVSTLETIVSKVSVMQDQMNQKFHEMDQNFDEMDKKFEKKFDEVQEVVGFLKDNVLMKDEAATKTELADFKSEVISHVDQFVKIQKKQEAEIVAVAHSLIRHEQTFHAGQACA